MCDDEERKRLGAASPKIHPGNPNLDHRISILNVAPFETFPHTTKWY